MTLTEYQIEAMKTRLSTANADYALFNLVGEVGEFYGKIAKFIRDEGDIYKYIAALKKELGDILWHVAAIAEDNEWTLDEIAEDNLAKLKDRQQRNVLGGSGDNR